MKPNARILIIKPSSLGDVVHGLPVLAALREKFPAAHIAWLVSTSFAPLLDDHPLLDEVIRFDRRRYGKMLRSPGAFAGFWRFVYELRRRKFDLVVDLQGLARSGWLSLLCGAPERIGFATAREGAWLSYSRRVPTPDPDEHAVQKNLRIAAALGADPSPARFPLATRPDEIAAARRQLHDAAGTAIEQFTAIVPGARWDSKRWPTDRIADLIDRLHDADLPRCVLLGGPDDRPLADAILARNTSGAIDLVGKTSIRELIALLSLADRVFCHDSGPMHLAAALNRPTVAIFGPTNPSRTGPYSPSVRVLQEPLDCAPCYRRECPLGHHDCMQRISAQTVADALRDLTLSQSAASVTSDHPAPRTSADAAHKRA